MEGNTDMETERQRSAKRRDRVTEERHRDREADADRHISSLPAQTTSLRQVCLLGLEFMLLQKYKQLLAYPALNSAQV